MSNIYTLSELVDLALKTPEVGAVNFNIIRILFLKMLSELNLENVTAEWKPVEINVDAGHFRDDEMHSDVHPCFVRQHQKEKEIGEREEEETDNLEKEEKEFTKREKTKSSFDDAVERPPTRDASVMTVESDTTSVSDESDDNKITESGATEIEYPAKKASEKPPKLSEGMKAGRNLFELWQIRKLNKRIEGIEEEITKLVEVVDELKEYNESRSKKIMFDEGERRQRKGDDEIVDRTEFEDTVDELGEAITRVAIKQRQQKEEFDAVNDGILKEVSFKVSVEDHENNTKQINKKLQIVGVAVKNIQSLLKEIIYPEACGIAKCMSCGRNAQLLTRYLLKNSHSKKLKQDTAEISLVRLGKNKNENQEQEINFIYAPSLASENLVKI